MIFTMQQKDRKTKKKGKNTIQCMMNEQKKKKIKNKEKTGYL